MSNQITTLLSLATEALQKEDIWSRLITLSLTQEQSDMLDKLCSAVVVMPFGTAYIIDNQIFKVVIKQESQRSY